MNAMPYYDVALSIECETDSAITQATLRSTPTAISWEIKITVVAIFDIFSQIRYVFFHRIPH